MSIEVEIKKIIQDDIVAKNFIETWYIINELLESFSKATELPISIFLEGHIVFTSPNESMPRFCQKLLKHPEMSLYCYQNAKERALEKPEKKKRKNRQIQLCHAGMINAKREIETGVGTLSILFGFKPAFSIDAQNRREMVIQKITKFSIDLANEIKNLTITKDFIAEEKKHIVLDNHNLEKTFFEQHDITLIDSITKILELLLNVTVSFRSLTINMAHELVVMLVGINLMSQETSETLNEIQDAKATNETISETVNLQRFMDSETKLGLYIVRNYLSQSSEYRYSQVVKPSFERLNLKPIIADMIEIYKWRADEKDLTILSEIEELPEIWGDKMELRRAFHNIFSNAIKYSYHSIEDRQRNIRIYSKLPYDPGFKSPRFAISFENYGLGLEGEELRKAFTPGFRGTQALQEVAIGSGIGLSEVRKIMTLHKGDIKFQSKKLWGEGVEAAFLTTISLIFPFASRNK